MISQIIPLLEPTRNSLGVVNGQSLPRTPNSPVMGFLPNAMLPGWGFTLRPLLDVNGELIQAPQNLNGGYKFTWAISANGGPQIVAGIPGNLPVYVNLTFDDGKQKLLRVVDDRLYFFSKRYRQADLYFPIMQMFSPNFQRDYVNSGGGSKTPSSTAYLVADILEDNSEYQNTPANPVLSTFSPLLMPASGASVTYWLTDIAETVPDPQVKNWINYFAYNDNLALHGVANKQSLGGFFVFQQYRRFRMSLEATAAQNIQILSTTDAIFNSNLLVDSGWQSNELILSTDPGWIASIADPGNFEYVLERECSYSKEWIWIASTGGAQTVQIKSFDITFQQ